MASVDWEKYKTWILAAASITGTTAAVTAVLGSVTAALAVAAPYLAIIAAVAAAIKAHVKGIQKDWSNADACLRWAFTQAAEIAAKDRRLVKRSEINTPSNDQCWHRDKTDKFKGRMSFTPGGPGTVLRRDAPRELEGPTWLGPYVQGVAGVQWWGGPWGLQKDGYLRRPGWGDTLSGVAPEAAAVMMAAGQAMVASPDGKSKKAAAAAAARVRALVEFKEKYDGLSAAEQYDQKIAFDGEPSHYYTADPQDLQDLLDFLDEASAGTKAPKGPLNQALGLKKSGGSSSSSAGTIVVVLAAGAAGYVLLRRRRS